jgi:glucokinase
MILAADIGGTNARFGLFEPSSRVPELVETFPRSSSSGVDELIERFVPPGAAIDAACLAVAGPVHDGRSRAVNLPWEVEAGAVARALGVTAVSVVNDLVANARGIPLLGPDDLMTLTDGEPDP